jgi:hypothetical protein
LALINILIDERAKDRLAAMRAERPRLEALSALLPTGPEAIRRLVELGLKVKSTKA